MYGWSAKMANFTNVGQSSSMKELVEFYNATGRPAVLELQGVFFTNMNATHDGKKMKGQMLRPDGQEVWAKMLPQIKQLIGEKILVGKCAVLCTRLSDSSTKCQKPKDLSAGVSVL